MKLCKICKEIKPIDLFYKHQDTKDKLRSECINCWKKLTTNYIEKNKERVKQQRSNYHFKSNYGLTKAEVDVLRAGQNYRCSLCKLNKPLVVDHDHNTGKVRELLCNTCNQGLGSFNENVEYFKEAINYLERHK